MPGEDSLASFRDGANWLVGLSAGAVTAALAYMDKIAGAPFAIRVGVISTVVLFLAAILSGVMYSFHLNSAMQLRQLRSELSTRIAAQPDDPDAAAWKKDRAAAEKDLNDEQGGVNLFHHASLWTFGGGLLVATLSLLGGLFFIEPPKAAVATPGNRYYVTSGLMHSAGRGAHSHIILVDQASGETWDLHCTKDGQSEFHRIQWDHPSSTPPVFPSPSPNPVKPAQ